MASMAFLALNSGAAPAAESLAAAAPLRAATVRTNPQPAATSASSRAGCSALPAAAVAASGAALVAAARRRRQKGLKAEARKSRVARCDGQAGRDSGVYDCVIVGSGVSGLSAAFQLLKDNPNASVAITEARDVVGGNITTRSANGRLWEEGPNSFQPGDPILSTACDVGLKDDILLADPSSYRFVWWEGQLRALPATPADAVFGDFLSWPGKIRAGLGAIGIRDPPPDREETVKEFVTRNLGEEAFERLIDPFVSGVYAGNPSKLSAEAATGRVQVLEKNGGSLVAGAIQLFQERSKEAKSGPPRDPRLPEVKGQTVGSFRNGLRQFAEALADHNSKAGAAPRLQWKLKKMAWDGTREEHVLEYETPSGPQTLRSKSVVLTSPTHVTKDLIRPLSEEASDALGEIFYPRVAAVTVEYDRSQFREPEHGKGIVNGFGQLHPRSQGIRTLGTIYSSSLFPGREPDPEKIMLLHYIGGARDPELFGGIEDMTDEQLVEATHKDACQTMLKPGQESAFPTALGVRVWPRAIPQLDVGHAQRLERCKKGLESKGIKGVFLAGNYAGGVALGRCVEFGLEIAKDVGTFVSEAVPSH